MDNIESLDTTGDKMVFKYHRCQRKRKLPLKSKSEAGNKRARKLISPNKGTCVFNLIGVNDKKLLFMQNIIF